MIYLDNSATTKCYPQVIQLQAQLSEECYFNPSAGYHASVEAHQRLEDARKRIAVQLGCQPAELIFTASGTEGDNLAIFGAFKNKKGRIITSEAEHPAVFQCFQHLKNSGYDVQFVRLNQDSTVDLTHLRELLTPNTTFVSVMHVQNETGAVNDIAAITALCKTANSECLVHSDGVQAFLKIPVDMRSLGVDLYTVSAHKIHGPKGVGALYVRKGVNPSLYSFGGGQEHGLRSGTENLPGISAFALACEISRENMEFHRLGSIKRLMRDIICKKCENVVVQADRDDSAPNILSLSVKGIKAEILQQVLSNEGIFIGKGSACSSKAKISRLHKALKLPADLAEGTIRISISYLNEESECRQAAEIIAEQIQMLRRKIR